MASEVYTVVEVALQDGTLVDLRPLPIAQLRKFMRIWNSHLAEVVQTMAEKGEAALTDPEMTDKQYDVYMKLSIIALERTLKDTKTTRQFEEYLGDNLDEPTIMKILEVCGGLTLGGKAARTAQEIQNSAQTEQ